eukprot:5629862-Prymnesium_polylepis.1
MFCRHLNASDRVLRSDFWDATQQAYIEKWVKHTSLMVFPLVTDSQRASTKWSTCGKNLDCSVGCQDGKTAFARTAIIEKRLTPKHGP